MNAIIQATIVAAPLLALGIMPARAQMPVIDDAALVQLVQSAKDGFATVNNLVSMGQTLNNQLIRARMIYDSVSHITEIWQIVPVLQQLGIQNPMPGDTAILQGLFNGVHGGPGAFGPQVLALLSQNPGYAPSGQDWQANRINQNYVASAGQWAAGQALYAANATRLDQLPALLARLGTAQTSAEKVDLQARIAYEQATAQAQGNQGVSMVLQQNAQHDQAAQLQEQAWRYSSDNLGQQALAAVNAASGGTVSLVNGQ